MTLRTRIRILHIISALFVLTYSIYAAVFIRKIIQEFSTFSKQVYALELSGLFLLSLVLILSSILFYKKKLSGWYALLLFFAYASLSGILDLIRDIGTLESTFPVTLVFDVISTGIYIFTLILLLDKGLYKFISTPHYNPGSP